MNIITIIIIIIINIQSGPPGFLRNGSAPRQILLHQIGCPVGFTFWICSFDKLIRDAGRGELDDGWKFFQDVFAENSNQWSFGNNQILKLPPMNFHECYMALSKSSDSKPLCLCFGASHKRRNKTLKKRSEVAVPWNLRRSTGFIHSISANLPTCQLGRCLMHFFRSHPIIG